MALDPGYAPDRALTRRMFRGQPTIFGYGEPIGDMPPRRRGWLEQALGAAVRAPFSGWGEKAYNPLTARPQETRDEADRTRALFLALARGNPEAVGGTAGAMLFGLPRGRFNLPHGFESALSARAYEHAMGVTPGVKHKPKAVAPLMGPKDFYEGVYERSQHGTPIEAYTRPPPVEEFMSPGNMTINAAYGRTIRDTETGRRKRREYAESVEEFQDLEQQTLNEGWFARRSEAMGRQKPGLEELIGRTSVKNIKRNDVLPGGQKVIKDPVVIGDALWIDTDQGSFSFDIHRQVGSLMRPRTESAARQAYNVPGGAERALRAHFARVRRKYLPEG